MLKVLVRLMESVAFFMLWLALSRAAIRQFTPKSVSAVTYAGCCR